MMFIGTYSMHPTRNRRERWYEPNEYVPLCLIDDNGREVLRLNEGFTTDGATVPRMFWSIPWLAPWDWEKAALCHDWCWEQRKSGRLVTGFAGSNSILRNAIIAQHYPRWFAWMIWFIVTTCGWVWWLRGERGTCDV